MSSIEEVRGQNMHAIEVANQSLGMFQQGRADLESAQQALLHAMEGSSQQDAAEAIGLFTQALASVDEVVQQVAAGISSAQDATDRL